MNEANERNQPKRSAQRGLKETLLADAPCAELELPRRGARHRRSMPDLLAG